LPAFPVVPNGFEGRQAPPRVRFAVRSASLPAGTRSWARLPLTPGSLACPPTPPCSRRVPPGAVVVLEAANPGQWRRHGGAPSEQRKERDESGLPIAMGVPEADDPFKNLLSDETERCQCGGQKRSRQPLGNFFQPHIGSRVRRARLTTCASAAGDRARALIVLGEVLLTESRGLSIWWAACSPWST
jgi:hypothetical protein